jgi:predicted alpha/beta hydrolase family esterase
MQICDLFHSFITYMKIEKFTLVTHSFGLCSIAKFIEKFPNYINGYVFIASLAMNWYFYKLFSVIIFIYFSYFNLRNMG